MRNHAVAHSSDVEEGQGKESQIASIETKKSFYTKLYKLVFCFLGLQVSYVFWGLVQEHLMTHEYALGKFHSSAFLVFANRFLALIISLGIVLFQRVMHPTKQTLKDVPFYYYAPSSLSNTISSWAQYEALKYVSFPTQVLSKSCKIIPVMLVGILLNKKSYPWSEYVEASLITLGVFMFTMSEKSSSHGGHDHADTSFGIGLLLLYLFCDSFTSQWQSRVFKQYNIDQYQMMLGVNIWSMIMTGFTLVQSGEFASSIAFILTDSRAFFHMTVLSVTSATGQLFIFYTIKELGPIIFTIIMTTRQIVSLFISCLVFSHPLSTTGWLSSVAVFGIVFNRIYRKGSD
jgi:adenosine 3'-phospho 5'-phosphosulfate transporter B2